MMNDRFSAQLRAHLLETADERPAEGQLAALLDGIGFTPQRHPMVARLPWIHERTGRSSRGALAYALLAAALIVILAALAIIGGGAVPPGPKGFEGTWASTDPGDGSAQTLVVGAGTRPAVHFEDAYATGLACRKDDVKRFTADGNGQIVGGHMDATFPDGGGCGSTRVDVGLSFDYATDDDSLIDQDGLRWNRVDGADTVVPPSISAVTPAPAPDAVAPTPRPDGCTDYVGGDTYAAQAGWSTVTATLPGGSESAWMGIQDHFALQNSLCLFGSSLWLQASPVTRVYPDACHRPGVGLLASTPALASSAFRAQEGLDVAGPVDVTIAGYPASRFELSVPASLDVATCTDGTLRPMDGITNMDADQRLTIYIVDVDGTPLAFVVYRSPDVDGALEAQADAIIGSLRIERTPPPPTPSPKPAPSLAQILDTGSLYDYAMSDSGALLTLWDSCKNEFDESCGHAWRLSSASESSKTGMLGLGDVHHGAYTADDGFILIPARRDDDRAIRIASDGTASTISTACTNVGWSTPTDPGRLVLISETDVLDAVAGTTCGIGGSGGSSLANGVVTPDGVLWGLLDNESDAEGNLTIGRFDGSRWRYHDFSTPSGARTSVIAASGPDVVVLLANQEISPRSDLLLGYAVSTDGGATWSETSEPATINRLPFAVYKDDVDWQYSGYTSMAFAGPSTLYVADALGRLWRSTDLQTFSEIPGVGHVQDVRRAGDAVTARVDNGTCTPTPCNRFGLVRISADGTVVPLDIG